MAYKISGVKSETARVMVLKESDWSIESNTVIPDSGAYEVGYLVSGTKTTFSRTEDGQIIGYGNIPASFYVPVFGNRAATPEVFNSAASWEISSAMLDSTHVLVSYSDAGNSWNGTSIVVTIDGTSISWGDEYTWGQYPVDISSVMLDSTHVVVSYKDGSVANNGTSRAVTIDGDVITVGSKSVFNSGTTTYISSTMLDSTHVLVSYRDNGNSSYGTSRIGTISGTSITWGSESVFNTATTTYISSAMLDSTHVLVSYRDSGNSSYGTSIIGTISGTSIAFGSESIFNSAYTSYTSSVMLDSTHVLVSYKDNGNSDYGTSIVGTISGTSITFPGNEVVFNSGDTEDISSVMLDSTHVMISYKDIGNSDYGTSIVGTIDGDVITFGSENVFNSAITEYISSVMLDSTHAMVSYQDNGNSNYGTSCILY